MVNYNKAVVEEEYEGGHGSGKTRTFPFLVLWLDLRALICIGGKCWVFITMTVRLNESDNVRLVGGRLQLLPCKGGNPIDSEVGRLCYFCFELEL